VCHERRADDGELGPGLGALRRGGPGDMVRTGRSGCRVRAAGTADRERVRVAAVVGAAVRITVVRIVGVIVVRIDWTVWVVRIVGVIVVRIDWTVWVVRIVGVVVAWIVGTVRVVLGAGPVSTGIVHTDDGGSTVRYRPMAGRLALAGVCAGGH